MANQKSECAVSIEAYPHMVNMIEQTYPEGRSRFRPSRARLDEIIAEGNELVANASKSDLERFSE
jgi:hypothetical protein